MATPAQVAAQALSNLARIGAFVGVGATVLSSAIYDGKSLKEFVTTLGKRLFFF
jgi:F0F1-type ATP synthase membrane subunit c/vacuolar-type H+-ATPase subunit K